MVKRGSVALEGRGKVTPHLITRHSDNLAAQQPKENSPWQS